MAKIQSSLIVQKSTIPDNATIKLKKESQQKKKENQNAMLQTPDYDFDALSRLYDLNSYHARCCDLKAGITTLLGFTIYDPNDPKADTKDSDEYKSIKSFVDVSIESLYNIHLDFEIFGNGYIEVSRDKGGKVSEVSHIPALWTEIKIDKGIRYLQQQINGQIVLYRPFEGENYKVVEIGGTIQTEYLHLKNYAPRNYYYGRPSYIGSIKTMYLDDSAVAFNTGRFNNNAVPDSIIMMYGFEKDETTKGDINKFFTNNFKGQDNFGKSLLLQTEASPNDTKIDIEKMSNDVKEASFRGMRNDNRDEVLSAHGVPPALVSVNTARSLGSGNEIGAQLEVFNETLILPRQKRLARLINKVIKEGMGIENWQIKFDSFEFANSVQDAQFYQAIVGSGIIKPDFAAQEMGYPPEAVPGFQEGTISKADGFAAIAKSLKNLRLTLEAMRD